MLAQTGSVLIAVVVFVAGPLSAAEDLPAVEKKLKAAWQKHTSMRTKMTVVNDFSMRGMSGKTKGHGTIEYMKKGTQFLSRSEQAIHTVTETQGRKMERNQKVTAIFDGKDTYVLMDTDGQVAAHKSKGSKGGADPTMFFEQTRKYMTLKLLSSEKADGKTVYVIEGTPKKKLPQGGFDRTRFHFREDGVMLKLVMFGPDGKPAMTVTHSDIELNVKIDPKRFVFKAPPGVKVQDMDDMMRSGTRRESPGL